MGNLLFVGEGGREHRRSKCITTSCCAKRVELIYFSIPKGSFGHRDSADCKRSIAVCSKETLPPYPIFSIKKNDNPQKEGIFLLIDNNRYGGMGFPEAFCDGTRSAPWALHFIPRCLQSVLSRCPNLRFGPKKLINSTLTAAGGNNYKNTLIVRLGYRMLNWPF